jgi:hypothetical protein
LSSVGERTVLTGNREAKTKRKKANFSFFSLFFPFFFLFFSLSLSLLDVRVVVRECVSCVATLLVVDDAVRRQPSTRPVSKNQKKIEKKINIIEKKCFFFFFSSSFCFPQVARLHARVH